MPKSKKRKKIDDDEDWVPEGKRKKPPNKKTDKYSGENCFIHMIDTDENLTKLPSHESWEKLLHAARIRGDEKVLQLESSSSTSDAKEYPTIFYHLSCRHSYTHKKSLETISKVSYLILYSLLWTKETLDKPLLRKYGLRKH